VLDPVPQPARSPLVRRLLEGVERVLVGAVADRMHGHGPADPRRPADDVGELVRGRDLDARAVQQQRGL
jgi:hypothetical protein